MRHSDTLVPRQARQAGSSQPRPELTMLTSDSAALEAPERLLASGAAPGQHTASQRLLTKSQHLDTMPCAQGGQDSQARRPELMVPASDSAALAAYVRLLASLAASGSLEQRAQRLASWEQAAQVAPLWELLFQLMCYPVPQVPPTVLCLGSDCMLGKRMVGGKT